MHTEKAIPPDPDQPDPFWPSGDGDGLRRARIEYYASLRDELGLVVVEAEDTQPVTYREAA